MTDRLGLSGALSKDKKFVPSPSDAVRKSAWAAEALWLYDYANLGSNASLMRHCKAYELANAVVQNHFEEPTAAFAKPTRCYGLSE